MPSTTRLPPFWLYHREERAALSNMGRRHRGVALLRDTQGSLPPQSALSWTQGQRASRRPAADRPRDQALAIEGWTKGQRAPYLLRRKYLDLAPSPPPWPGWPGHAASDSTYQRWQNCWHPGFPKHLGGAAYQPRTVNLVFHMQGKQTLILFPPYDFGECFLPRLIYPLHQHWVQGCLGKVTQALRSLLPVCRMDMVMFASFYRMESGQKSLWTMLLHKHDI